MEPYDVNKLGDVFKFLGEQQAKLEKLAGEFYPEHELCELCGLSDNECSCEEQFI